MASAVASLVSGEDCCADPPGRWPRSGVRAGNAIIRFVSGDAPEPEDLTLASWTYSSFFSGQAECAFALIATPSPQSAAYCTFIGPFFLVFSIENAERMENCP